jgi:outer membrane protein insertion porin family
VAFVLVAEPSRRAYVRRINIAGNNRTRDEVIRREFRQFESSWYDADKIKLSRDRIDRLGYFKDVNVETSDVPGAPDQVDLNLNVSEKPTGSLQLGAAFPAPKSWRCRSRSSRKTPSATATTRRRSQHQQVQPHDRFSSVKPYFHAGRRSRTSTCTRTSALRGPGRQLPAATTGAGLRFGIPVQRTGHVFSARAERTEIKPAPTFPAAYLRMQRFGYTSRLPL